MSILKRQVSSSSIFVSFYIVTTHNFSVNFELIHFLLWTIGSHQSSNFDTFKCSGENLPNSCHFPSNKSISFKFCITLQCHEGQLLCTFLAQTIYTLFRSWVLRLKFVKFLMPISLQILYPSSVSSKITSLYFFSSNNI